MWCDTTAWTVSNKSKLAIGKRPPRILQRLRGSRFRHLRSNSSLTIHHDFQSSGRKWRFVTKIININKILHFEILYVSTFFSKVMKKWQETWFFCVFAFFPRKYELPLLRKRFSQSARNHPDAFILDVSKRSIQKLINFPNLHCLAWSEIVIFKGFLWSSWFVASEVDPKKIKQVFEILPNALGLGDTAPKMHCFKK